MSSTTDTLQARSVALTATLGLAAACWVVAVRQMNGMDMGVATPLGSFGFFVALWVSMMAAMMLPGAAPAVLRRAAGRWPARAVPLFVGAVPRRLDARRASPCTPLYRPHGSVAAGVVAIAAGVYELTPLKQQFRERCRESVGSGLEFGLYCVGSSIGLMLVLVAVSVMSVAWMSVIAVLVVAQKLVRPQSRHRRAAGAGDRRARVLIVIASSVPGLMPAM